jgi:release factor glutamine methyltransferase
LDLEVAPGVLIPRPETEVLVDHVLRHGRDGAGGGGVALDLGTGTGAIALSLAFEGSFASVVATDIDERALNLARRNAESAGVGDTIDLRAGSLFDPLGPGERFDVIVSNPPYIAESDEGGLQPEVVDWEPHAALFAGPDGLDVLVRIVERASDHLRERGLLALEVGSGQATCVADMLRATRSYATVEILRDYAGKERFVFARGA